MSIDQQCEREAAAIAKMAFIIGKGPPEPPYIARLRKACRRWRYGWVASMKAHARLAQGHPPSSYNPVTPEDRQRHARKRLDRAKKLLLLKYEARKYVRVEEACQLVSARPRTIGEWVEKGYVRRVNAMVYVPDLRKHLGRKLHRV